MTLQTGKNHNMRNIVDESVIIRHIIFVWFMTRLALPDPPPPDPPPSVVCERSKLNTPFPSDTPTTSTPLSTVNSLL